MVQTKKIIYILLGLLVLIAVLSLFLGWDYKAGAGKLQIIFCDVGQGDAILIRTPAGDDILIDGGPDNSVLSCLGEYLPFNDRKIELVFLTHPHADHLVGLITVFSQYQIDNFYVNNLPSKDKNVQELMKVMSTNKIFPESVADDKIFTLGKDSSLEILFAGQIGPAPPPKDWNKVSIVGRLVYKNSSFLLTGDLGQEKEKELVAAGKNLDVDVLKVGHHGSSTSSGDQFLSVVSPEIAVISVGADNKFGHPSLRTVRRLERSGSSILRTDQDGNIKLVSDGVKIWPE